MTNNILLFLIACCFIGIIFACLATDVSFGSTEIAFVEVPMSEIEIEFVPTTSIEIPTSEIEITFIPVK
tara:strand:+ start:860 stop:1066 length:207 start_codon:yes stop_codon:yes gene_type:complete